MFKVVAKKVKKSYRYTGDSWNYIDELEQNLGYEVIAEYKEFDTSKYDFFVGTKRYCIEKSVPQVDTGDTMVIVEETLVVEDADSLKSAYRKYANALHDEIRKLASKNHDLEEKQVNKKRKLFR